MKKIKSQRFSFAFAFVIQREKILNPGIFIFSLVIVSVRMVIKGYGLSGKTLGHDMGGAKRMGG